MIHLDTPTKSQTQHRKAGVYRICACLLMLMGVGRVAIAVVQHQVFLWDLWLLRHIHAYANPSLDRAMIGLSELGGATIIAPISAAIGLYLWWQRPQAARFWFLAVAGAAALNIMLKFIFQRARPELWPRLLPESDYGFPSGHAMYSAAFVLALLLLFWPMRWRLIVVVLGGLFVLALGLSRLYLGVHYPSDVLVGWCAGCAWTSLMWSFSRERG